MIKFRDPIGTAEAARIAGESPSNFAHYVRRGETPEPIKIGRFQFFERQEMEDWIKPFKKPGNKKGRRK